MNLIIVGNKFTYFSDNQYVITANEFIKLIKNNNYCLKKDDKIFIGQGIKKSELMVICNFLTIHDILYVHCPEKNTKENRKYVHKLKSKNVVITKPKKIADIEYRSDLCFSDDCEILDDHTTGFHLQGMLILEAARQMMISVVENYFLLSNEKFNKRFTLLNIDSHFYRYLFPLSVEITAKIKILSEKQYGFKADITCEFMQNEFICSTVVITFCVSNENHVIDKESKMSEELVKKLLSKI